MGNNINAQLGGTEGETSPKKTDLNIDFSLKGWLLGAVTVCGFSSFAYMNNEMGGDVNDNLELCQGIENRVQTQMYEYNIGGYKVSAVGEFTINAEGDKASTWQCKIAKDGHAVLVETSAQPEIQDYATDADRWTVSNRLKDRAAELTP